MAKNKPTNTFGDSKKKLPSDRMNLKPIDPSLTEEQYLAIALKEGEALLEAEAQEKANSVKTPSASPPPVKTIPSSNPYARAHAEVLNKMEALARSVIEKMERGEIEKDYRYKNFCKQISTLGDQFSNEPKQ